MNEDRLVIAIGRRSQQRTSGGQRVGPAMIHVVREQRAAVCGEENREKLTGTFRDADAGHGSGRKRSDRNVKASGVDGVIGRVRERLPDGVVEDDYSSSTVVWIPIT
jgi:hypothetical protein